LNLLHIHDWLTHASQNNLEIKCPSKKPYDEIPWIYYDQIQFGMFNLGLKWCDFYAWTPHAGTKLGKQYALTWLKMHDLRKNPERFAFNERYWNEELYPKLENFYMNKFLPEAIKAIEAQRSWTPQTARYTKKLHL